MRCLFMLFSCIFLCHAFALAKTTVFQIGKPDASAAEFKSFRGLDDTRFEYMTGYPERFRAYRNLDKSIEFFKNPVVFTVGKSEDFDWPFIQPVANCPWAGADGGGKTYCIKFDTPKTGRNFFLKIGYADSSQTGIGIQVRLNGKKIGGMHGFFYDKNALGRHTAPASLHAHPEGYGVASNPFKIEIDRSALKSDGTKNTLELVPVFDDKSSAQAWIVYDFIELSDTPDYPQIPDHRTRLLDMAISAMGTEEVIFCTRGEGRDWHWYANYGKLVPAKTGNADVDYCFDQELFSRMGGKLIAFNLRTGKYRLLLDDPKGCIRDAQMHYGGKKILFSYRKGDSDTFHLYEIDSDGKNLYKLPMATYANDIEPCYMPNGDILYTSDRLHRTVQCWMVPVSNLHRWFRGENKIRAISVNPDVDNRPRLLSDGRIIYMRWDYNHRSQVSYHHLWTMNPDGSNDMIYLGNDKPGGLFIGAQQLPGKDGVVFTCAPGHGIKDHRGDIATTSSSFDPSSPYSFTYINGERYPHRHNLFDPYPLKGGIFLATSYHGTILIYDKHGLFYEINIPPELLSSTAKVKMNLSKTVGGKERHIPYCKVIARNIQPLAPRPHEAQRVDNADFTQETAQVFLQDIYHGRKMNTVERGSIKELIIAQVLPEPVHYHGGYYPLNYNGGFAIEKIWGTVPVYEDGSAKFEVPARRPLAFIAIDKNGRAVKRMQSFVGFAPGTSTSCIGCHENRTEAPIRKMKLPIAYGKEISKISPIAGVPPVIDYMHHIQPILDKYCLECHNPRNASGGVILSGGLAPKSIMSLMSLRMRGQIISGGNEWGNMPPYTFGSGGSKLMDKLQGRHHARSLDKKDLDTMRAWLDTGAFQIGTYAGVGTGFIFDSFFENGYSAIDGSNPNIRAVNEVIGFKCSACHNLKDKKEFGLYYAPWVDIRSRIKANKPGEGVIETKFLKGYLFDYLYPENSLALLTPLAKSAGGLAEGSKEYPHPVVFKDKNDYEYKKLCSNLKAVSAYLRKTRPFVHEKNFRPSYGYVQVMKRMGLLAADFPDDAPIPPLEMDEKYFKWQDKNLTLDLSKRPQNKVK